MLKLFRNEVLTIEIDLECLISKRNKKLFKKCQGVFVYSTFTTTTDKEIIKCIYSACVGLIVVIIGQMDVSLPSTTTVAAQCMYKAIAHGGFVNIYRNVMIDDKKNII